MTTKSEVRRAFPRLAAGQFEVTSPSSPSYNCIAWAAGDDRRWWEPSGLGGHYWPPGLPRGWRHYTLENYVDAFKAKGFAECDTADLEAGVEKVAIFADSNWEPTHAARQLSDGAWTSKLGRWVDIAHKELGGVEGQDYGAVVMIMCRPASNASPE